MVDLVISLDKVSLDTKINGTLNIYLSTENIQDRMTYQTIICKGQLVIQQKFRFNILKQSQSRCIQQNLKTINLLKNQIYLKFQLVNNSCRFQKSNLYQKRLNFSSLHRKENTFLEYLNPKFGRGSMLSYTIKLQKQSNLNLNANQSQETLSTKGQISKNPQLLVMQKKHPESSIDFQNQLKSKQKNKMTLNEKTKYKKKTQNTQKKHNCNINDTNEQSNKNNQKQLFAKQLNQIYKGSRQKDDQDNSILRIMKTKLYESQIQIQSLLTQIVKIKKESQIWRLQNKKLEQTIKQTKQVIVDKELQISRIKSKMLNMQTNFKLKEDLLKQQIVQKVIKIKEMSQKNSQSTMQISKLMENFSDKQKGYFKEIDRLKQLIMETSSQRKLQKIKNYKSQTKFNYLSNDQMNKLKQISLKKFSVQDFDSNMSGQISECTDLNMPELQKSFNSQDSIQTIYLKDGQNGVLMEKRKPKKEKQLQKMYFDLNQKFQNAKVLLLQQKQSINILSSSNFKLANQLQKKEQIIELKNSQISKLMALMISGKNNQTEVNDNHC